MAPAALEVPAVQEVLAAQQAEAALAGREAQGERVGQEAPQGRTAGAESMGGVPACSSLWRRSRVGPGDPRVSDVIMAAFARCGFSYGCVASVG